MSVHTAEPYVEPPNDADIEMALKKLQNLKATVHNQIPTKLIKERGKSSRRSFLNHLENVGGKDHTA